MKRYCCAVVLLCLGHFQMAASGRVHHVAVHGSDDGPGTVEQPLASIQQAVDRAEPGDVIRLGPGVFHQTVVFRRSGREAAPITLEGTRGPAGERLSWVAPGTEVSPEIWESAPEVGPNVYRARGLSWKPRLLTISGRLVACLPLNNWKVRHSEMPQTWLPASILAWPEDQRVTTESQYAVSVPFWRTVGGLYTWQQEEGADPELLLRLAGGTDPREQNMTLSPGGAVVALENAGHVVVRGLEIAFGEIGLQISGPQAQHNLIEDCAIRHGRIRVHISGGASHNTVRGNYIAMDFLGERPGAWGDDSQKAGRREYIYNFFKYMASPSASSDDRAIYVRTGADHTTIEDNFLDGGLVAITTSDNRGLIVRRNVIRDFSSVGLSIVSGSVDAHFFDNLVYNCNKNIRLHRLNQGDGYRVFIYRNRFFQPDGLGEHIYTYTLTEAQLKRMGIEQYDDPEVVIHQNIFLGGGNFWSQTRGLRRGAPGFHFLNNTIISQRVFRWHRADSRIGVFDHNRILSAEAPDPWWQWPWFGASNRVDVDETRDWSAWTLEDLHALPENMRMDPSLDLGFDPSQRFSVGGACHDVCPEGSLPKEDVLGSSVDG